MSAGLFGVRPVLCLACGAEVPEPRPATCGTCRAPLTCPPGRELPQAVRQLVLRRKLAQLFAVTGADEGWRLLLANAFRGSIVETVAPNGTRRRVVVTMATGADEVYAAALVAAGLHTTQGAKPRDGRAA